MPDDVDVLVIGGGMAGLTAAVRSIKTGARVLLVESATSVGGSAQYAGYVWTAPDRETMARVNPLGDKRLRNRLVDGLDDGVEWIRSLGVECKDAVLMLGFGRGHQFDAPHYIDECRRIIRAEGELLTHTSTSALVMDEGAVVGAGLVLADGSRRTVRASATILATGGFQADHDLVDRHIHPLASTVELRSNPMSRGDGLRLAQRAGAGTGKDGAGFYGHLVPAGVRLGDDDFVSLALYYSEHALLFNLAGERFADETLGDHLTTMALLEQPEARGLLVADARVHRDWMSAQYVEGAPSTDKFALAQKRTDRLGVADSVEDLGLLPPEWGYDGEKLARSVRTYNDQAARGQPMVPGRANDDSPLAEAPYYVVEVRPAITFPFHGVLIDEEARVLDRMSRPIPGLFAAGADTGGLYYRSYAGGIAPALVFGLTAADRAAADRAATH
ncbi:FAD-dependent oxidoreductase [Allosalinactinospora lopnorensis]|uniref:FAD-dependent oxidoreductase n=1 Tax=Allosalinactinospora lopnorensis TaxID=1352348 RepID=UPI0009E31ECD|nr:FAD-binding protein [Allosalinactinospora lopnorensis]